MRQTATCKSTRIITEYFYLAGAWVTSFLCNLEFQGSILQRSGDSTLSLYTDFVEPITNPAEIGVQHEIH
jgi:hypothetical protein